VSRLKRDARFAKGKSEYKSEFFIMLHPLGKKAAVATYYLHVQPGRSYAGADAFNPPLGTLNAVREAIAEIVKGFTICSRHTLSGPTFQMVLPLPAPSSRLLAVSRLSTWRSI